MSSLQFNGANVLAVLRALRYGHDLGDPRHPWLDLTAVSDRLRRDGRQDTDADRVEALRGLLTALVQLELIRLYGGSPPEGWQHAWWLLGASGSRTVEGLATVYARFFAADQPTLDEIGDRLNLPGSTVERRQQLGLDLLARLLDRRELASGLPSDRSTPASPPSAPSMPPSAPDAAVAGAPAEVSPAVRAHLQRCVAEGKGPVPALDQRFVNLTLLLDRGPDTVGERFSARDRLSGGLRQLLAEDPASAFVLLGPPGSGKTSLLRRLELEVAEALLAGAVDRVPFFVSLSQYPVDAIALEQPMAWLEGLWQRRAAGAAPLTALLDAGRLLLLADGLNELPHRDDNGYRDLLRGWKLFLQAEFAVSSGNRAIFTCRSLDYSVGLSTAVLPVQQVVVDAMDDEAMHAFLQRHDAPGLGQELLGPDLWDLLRRPLMLRLLAEQTVRVGSLPRGRVGLITGFIREALRRELERDHPLLRSGPLFSAHDLRRVSMARAWARPHDLPDEGPLFGWLRDFAWRLQQGQASADGSQVHAPRRDLPRLLPEAPIDDLLAVGGALGLLTEDLGRDEVAFAHQLFQEYFAARRLAGEPRPALASQDWTVERVRPSLADCIAELSPADPLPPLPGTGWDEVMLMAAPMAEDPNAFISGVMEVNLPLAGRVALQPELTLDPDLRLRLQRHLADRARDRGADLRARLAAADVLGRLGDPRMAHDEGPAGPYLLPPWVRVPAGEHELPAAEAGGGTARIRLDGFLIGQGPVTNAEFACFIRAGGYEDERWWPAGPARDWFMGIGTNAAARRQELEWYHRFLEEPGLLQGFVDRGVMGELVHERWRSMLAMDASTFALQLAERHPDGRMSAPRYWRGESQEPPNHPVVGVSLFEAEAYCRWLSSTSGLMIRLPRREEWLAAGLLDPRGDLADPAEANVLEQHIRGTCPTGVFAWPGRWGEVFDYVGNVLEWLEGSPAFERSALRSAGGDRPSVAETEIVSVGWVQPNSDVQDCLGSKRRFLAGDGFGRDVGLRIVRGDRPGLG